MASSIAQKPSWGISGRKRLPIRFSPPRWLPMDIPCFAHTPSQDTSGDHCGRARTLATRRVSEGTVRPVKPNLARVRVQQIVLPQKILAVIVPVRRSNYDVNVLPVGLRRIGGEPRQGSRHLMIELDQDHRAVNAIVVNARPLRSADPGEPGVVEMPLHLLRLHPRVPVVHVADVQIDEAQKLLALLCR